MRVSIGLAIAVVSAGIGLLGTNAILLARNRALATQVRSLMRPLEPPIGNKIRLLSGQSVDGKSREVKIEESRPNLIFVFAPGCQACETNWPKWKQLASVTQGGSVKRIYADLSGEVDGRYLDQHNIANEEVLLAVSPQSILANNLRFTPQTILVIAGDIRGVWSGVLSDGHMDEILDLLPDRGRR